MAGHVHTCAQCGHHMHINERYYGRELRCTGCRAAFLAESPPEEPQALPEQPEESGSRTALYVVGATVLAMLALTALFAWLGGPREGEVRTGRYGVVSSDPGPEILATFDRDTVQEATRLSAAGDADGAEELVSAFRAVRVASGTRLEVLEGGGPGSPVRVRLLTGPWTTKKVWLLAEWVEYE